MRVGSTVHVAISKWFKYVDARKMVSTFVVSNKVMVEGKTLFAVISNVKTTPHATRRSDFSGLFE